MHSLSVIDSLVSFLDSTGTLGAVNFLGLCWVDCSGANQMWGMWSDYVMLADNVMCQTLLCKREKESGAWSDFHLLQGFCMYIVFAYVHAYLVILWLSFQEDTVHVVRVQLIVMGKVSVYLSVSSPRPHQGGIDCLVGVGLEVRLVCWVSKLKSFWWDRTLLS